MTDSQVSELLVYDNVDQCPYLPSRTARMPLRMPTRKIEPAEFDARLAAGDRRSGVYLYNTACPGCQACESIRLEVDRFHPSRTQNRVLRRGKKMLTTEIGEPLVDRQRIDLFNAHRSGRGLAWREPSIDEFEYRAFLVETCCDTLEIRYLLDGRLIAVAIADRGAKSLSAVYCYFDPAYSYLSPGVYSILTQIELGRRWNLQYLYLGYYVAGSPHMKYKESYRPHERLVDGSWRRFDR